MKESGQIVLVRLPHTNAAEGKLRPALMIAKLPGMYDDWLVSMVSSQRQQSVHDFDEIIREEDEDYSESGLKAASVIRLGRLAVVEGSILAGAIGQISSERMKRIKNRLATWILGS